MIYTYFFQIQYFGTFFKCKKEIVDSISFPFKNSLKDHQKVEMVIGANGKIQEKWIKETGRIKYNDLLLKTTWNMEQVNEDGNHVLKPLAYKTNRVNPDGSSFQQDWTVHWFNLFKFPDKFFEIPKHCRNL